MNARCLDEGSRRFGRPSALAACGLVLAVTQCLCSPTAAIGAEVDVVRLNDGSVLKGEILRVVEDELEIDTEFADEVRIDVEYIVGIESSRRFTVRLIDGDFVSGVLTVSPDGMLIIRGKRSGTMERASREPIEAAPLERGAGETLETSAAASAVRAATPADVVPGASAPVGESVPMGPQTTFTFDDVDWIEPEPPFLRFEGDLNVGVQASRGNTDTTDLHFDASLVPSFGWNTISLSGEFDKKEADGETTTDRWFTQGLYERDIGRRWLATAVNTYEQDNQRDLDLRIVAGAGVGYKIFDAAPTYLKVTPSLAYVIERFSGDTDDREFPGSLWKLDFERELYTDDFVFYHNHRVINSLEQLSNFIAQTRTGLKFDLIDDFTLSAEYQFDWNNEPAADADQDDSRYLLKIGYEFEGDETDWWQ